jgi:NAD(P)-dependent dehydrogenase (short-subunit alcohol dehydrogenase family)
VRTDVSLEADVAALMDDAVETYGRIDCAFNSAGRELNVGIVAVNTKGVFFCLKHEIRHMRTTGGGAIVNNNSAAGLVPTDANHLYGMSKRAVTHLTQTAARDGGKLGIRVNEIAPAMLMKEMGSEVLAWRYRWPSSIRYTSGPVIVRGRKDCSGGVSRARSEQPTEP